MLQSKGGRGESDGGGFTFSIGHGLIERALVVLLVKRVLTNQLSECLGRYPHFLLVRCELEDRAEVIYSETLLFGQHLQRYLVRLAELEVAEG